MRRGRVVEEVEVEDERERDLDGVEEEEGEEEGFLGVEGGDEVRDFLGEGREQMSVLP